MSPFVQSSAEYSSKFDFSKPPPPLPEVDNNRPWRTSTRTRRYRFLDATLIDLHDIQIYRNVVVDVEDGIVRGVHKLGGPNALIQHQLQAIWYNINDCTLVNLKNQFILPGLIDCHVHFATPPGEDGLRNTLNQDPSTSLLRQTYLAGEMLKRGFTTVRDCGGAGVALKEAIDEGLVQGPRLFISGHGISPTGGHGDLRSSKEDEYGCCNGSVRGLGRIADGPDQCLHAAREELRRGADFIKIMVSGGIVSPADRMQDLQYTAAEIQAFARVAKDAGTYVTAHAYSPAAIRTAVENGVSGIEHGNFIDQSTARLMAHTGTVLTPTLVTYEAMASKDFEGFLPPALAAKNLQALKAGYESVRIADEAGVQLCFGTDLLGPLQVKQTREFVLRKRAGLSPIKILQSATINAARQLGQMDRLGRIKEGAHADMLILNANPMEDIGILDRPDQHLLAVIKGGRVVESRWSKLPVDRMSPPNIA